MRGRFLGFVSIVVLVSLLSIPSMGQDKDKAAKKGGDKKQTEQKANIQGTVQNMSKEASTITVRTTGTATRTVVYSPSTKFLYGHSDNNKPGSVAQVKDSNYISCAGTFDAKSQLVATECVYRETK